MDPAINFGKVQVSTGYDDTAVSIVLSTGHGGRLPDPSSSGAFNMTYWNWTDYKDPSDDPDKEIVRCTARSTDTLTIVRAQEGTTATVKNVSGKTYKMALSLTKKVYDDLVTALFGKKLWHGVLSRSAMSPLPANLTTTTFTLAGNTTAITYYYLGTLVTVNSSKTATLDDGAGGSTAGLYFVYFNAATGNILATKTFPGITNTSNVIIATVYWNGSNYGIVNDERHAYDRDCEWHMWAHSTISARYGTGLAFTYSGTTVANTTFQVGSGNIYDEDINFAIGNITTARIWYQTSASTYGFDTAVATTPYKVSGAGIQCVSSVDYSLNTVTSSARYLNYWVFGTTSNTTPVHIFCETTATVGGYNSTATARAVVPPSLAGLGLGPEYKLLYRLVVNGAGLIQTPVVADDYRTTSSVSGASFPSVTASTVTSNPPADANILSTETNVQSALNTINEGAYKQINKIFFADFATTVNITIANDLNAGDTVDGVTLVAGMIGLVKDQTAGAENGLYVVGASPARWTRYNTDALIRASEVRVKEGTANYGKIYSNTNVSAISVGTTAITYALAGGGGGGLTWTAVTTDGNLVGDTGTLANKNGLLTLTLPSTCAVGKIISIAGMHATGTFKIAQGANQYIRDGNGVTITGTTGFILSILPYDSISIICVVADVGFSVISATGSLLNGAITSTPN